MKKRLSRSLLSSPAVLLAMLALATTARAAPGAARKLVTTTKANWTIENITSSGGRVFFTQGSGATSPELWSTDGTVAGTKLVTTIGGGATQAHRLTDANGTLFFFTGEGRFGPIDAAWTSNGTAGGTTSVAAVSATPLTLEAKALGSKVFFNGASLANGFELWSVDAAGARLVNDIHPSASSNPSAFFTAAGNLYFEASDPAGAGLFATNGTAAPQKLAPRGPLSFFSPAGTHAVVGSTVYVMVEEILATNGTKGGTKSIGGKDQNWVTCLSALPNGTLVFIGDTTTGDEIFVSDGTTVPATPIKEIGAGAADGASRHRGCAVADSSLFFWEANAATLWKTDGTAAGTAPVKAFPDADLLPTEAVPMKAVGGGVAFAIDDGVNGRELWYSDGTDAGTTLVQDILLGAGSSEPSQLTVVGSNLYFTATSGANTRDLWVYALPGGPGAPDGGSDPDGGSSQPDGGGGGTKDGGTGSDDDDHDDGGSGGSSDGDADGATADGGGCGVGAGETSPGGLLGAGTLAVVGSMIARRKRRRVR